MTEEEKKELKEECAIAATKEANSIDPKLIEAFNRVHGGNLSAVEKIYVDEMNKLARDMAKKSDIEMESKIKARIFDDHWMQRIEEHLERHLPYMLDHERVRVRWPGRDAEVLEGKVEELDSGYVLIRDDRGVPFVVTWNSGPVFENLEPSAATSPEKKPQ